MGRNVTGGRHGRVLCWVLGLSLALMGVVETRAAAQQNPAPPPAATGSTTRGAGPAPAAEQARPSGARPPSPQRAPSPGAAEAAGGAAGQPSNEGAAEWLAPSQLRRGPSMHETGRVGAMSVQEAGVQIRQTSGRGQSREAPIAAHTSAPMPARQPSSGQIIEPAAFERDLVVRFARLRACKVEVARQRRTTPGALGGSRLTLRWTILPDGHVTDTVVVAVARASGHVLDCIKRGMSQWAFDPPRGGSVRIERPFQF